MIDYVQLEQDFNDDVKEWARLTISSFEFKLTSLGINDRSLARAAFKKAKTRALTSPKYKTNKKGEKQIVEPEKPIGASLRMAYSKKFGLINRVKIRFSRHGVFLEQGVGRGRKKGSGKEHPKKWLNPVLTVEVPKLADRMVNRYADIVAEELTFFIPGVIDMTFNTTT